MAKVRKTQMLEFKKIRDDARACFGSARGSHDWDHTERVFGLCLRIGRREKADLGVLRLAAVLHDIGREEEDRSNGRICHGERGAALAAKILKKHGVDHDTIARVVHCIAAHRYRGRHRPESLEAKILFDADKLDSIGAMGIGRAFLFAGEVGARLHDPAVDIRRTKPYTRDDTAYREFLVKLSRIKDRMHTCQGKRIARERHRFMAAFFDRLNKETRGLA
ncbi:MAG: phosphohydrolase [Candidatus Aminicenantes bacterium RBG_16_63_16]|nr:MAG: phosphohydrolase [Candidatus Aminicenantes bacterium RBG_16_63_16]